MLRVKLSATNSTYIGNPNLRDATFPQVLGQFVSGIPQALVHFRVVPLAPVHVVSCVTEIERERKSEKNKLFKTSDTFEAKKNRLQQFVTANR